MRTERRLYELNLPPDIVALAQTHHELSPLVRERVLATIRDYERQHRVVQVRIDGLDASNQDILQDDENLRDKLQACRSLLSPIRRVPFEIMGEIFAFYHAAARDTAPLTRNEDNDRDRRATSNISSAGAFCLVSKHWRDIALASPATWSDIKIVAQQQGPNQKPLIKSTDAQRLSSRLDRVGSFPWSLTIDSRGRTDSDSTVPSVLLSKLLIEHPTSQQLQRLTICGDTFAIGLGELSLPKVTSAVIWSDSYGARSDIPAPTTPDLPTMSSLAQAVFCEVMVVNTIYIPFHVPWSQLTHLFCEGNVRQVICVLKNCAALQKGCFSIDDGWRDETAHRYPEEPAQVTLPYLTDLVYIFESPFPEPIEGLSLPALTRFQLLTGWSPGTWCFENADLFRGLTHLTIANNPCSPNDTTLVQILENLPLLAELFCPIGGDSTQVLEFLTFGAQGRFNLPHLKALGLYISPVPFRQDEYDRGHAQVDYNIPYMMSRAQAERVDGLAHIKLPDFIASRTRAIHRGDFQNVPQAIGISLLEHFVLHVNGSEKMVAKLRQAITPYASYGMRMSVFGWKDRREGDTERLEDVEGENEDKIRERYLWARGSPAPYEMKHWDDGFMEFSTGNEWYTLYPKKLPGSGLQDTRQWSCARPSREAFKCLRSL